jgi:hypothetical protein
MGTDNPEPTERPAMGTDSPSPQRDSVPEASKRPPGAAPYGLAVVDRLRATSMFRRDGSCCGSRFRASP